MLTHNEISTYSLQAEQGDFNSLCALAVENLLNPHKEDEGFQQLKSLAKKDTELLVYLALYHLRKGNKKEALLLLAKATDKGSTFAPFYLWTLMPEDNRYLLISKERNNLLALRASLQNSPSFGAIDDFLADHQRALEMGDFDSFYFCCSDGFAYYKPELSFLQQNLYKPLLNTLFDTSKTINVENIEYSALSGIPKAFPLQANILMEQKKWSEALFWLLPAREDDSEQLKDIGVCFLELYRNTKKEEYLHSALTHLVQAKELDSLDAQEHLKPYKGALKYLSSSHWVYMLPPYWIFYLVIAFCVIRLLLFFVFPIYSIELYTCISGIILGGFLSFQRVPSFIYAMSDAPRITNHGIRQRNIWAFAKKDKHLYKAARQNHLGAMYRMGVQGNSDYLRSAAEQKHIPSIFSLYQREPQRMIEVLESIEEAHHIDVHRTLGMLFFQMSDFAKATKHLLFVLAKNPDDIQVKRSYAWSLHQKSPFASQWLLSTLSEQGDIESLFRLQELQRRIKENNIPFPISKPSLPVFYDKPFLRPKENILSHLSSLSIHSLRLITRTLGEQVWSNCNADTVLKKKLALGYIGEDFYPRQDEELVKENAQNIYDTLQNLRAKNSLYFSEGNSDIIRLLLQYDTSLEDLCYLDPAYAQYIHDYTIADLIYKSFVFSSPALKKWVLAPAGTKKSNLIQKQWNCTLQPLSEVITAKEKLLNWLIDHPKIPFPVAAPLLIETKVSQSLIQEFFLGASAQDIKELYRSFSNFWYALAFFSPKNIKKLIVQLEYSTKEKERILHNWEFHHKLQRLYEDSVSSIYAKSSVQFINIILKKMNDKTLLHRPFSIRLYAIPFEKYPESVLSLLLNESKEPVSVLATIKKIKRYTKIYDFYSEEIRETGKLSGQNKHYHMICNYLLVRSLMNKGLIKRKMFEHRA